MESVCGGNGFKEGHSVIYGGGVVPETYFFPTSAEIHLLINFFLKIK